jgi:hypothetical protein
MIYRINYHEGIEQCNEMHLHMRVDHLSIQKKDCQTLFECFDELEVVSIEFGIQQVINIPYPILRNTASY